MVFQPQSPQAQIYLHHEISPWTKYRVVTLCWEQKPLPSTWNGWGVHGSPWEWCFHSMRMEIPVGVWQDAVWRCEAGTTTPGLYWTSSTLARGKQGQTKLYQALLGGEKTWTPFLWGTSHCKVWFDSEWKQARHCLNHKTPQAICLGSIYLFGLASDFCFSFENKGQNFAFVFLTERFLSTR